MDFKTVWSKRQQGLELSRRFCELPRVDIAPLPTEIADPASAFGYPAQAQTPRKPQACKETSTATGLFCSQGTSIIVA